MAPLRHRPVHGRLVTADAFGEPTQVRGLNEVSPCASHSAEAVHDCLRIRLANERIAGSVRHAVSSCNSPQPEQSPGSATLVAVFANVPYDDCPIHRSGTYVFER